MANTPYYTKSETDEKLPQILTAEQFSMITPNETKLYYIKETEE